MTEEQKQKLHAILWDGAMKLRGYLNLTTPDIKNNLSYVAAGFCMALDMSVKDDGDEVTTIIEDVLTRMDNSPIHFIWTYLYIQERDANATTQVHKGRKTTGRTEPAKRSESGSGTERLPDDNGAPPVDVQSTETRARNEEI